MDYTNCGNSPSVNNFKRFFKKQYQNCLNIHGIEFNQSNDYSIGYYEHEDSDGFGFLVALITFEMNRLKKGNRDEVRFYSRAFICARLLNCA